VTIDFIPRTGMTSDQLHSHVVGPGTIFGRSFTLVLPPPTTNKRMLLLQLPPAKNNGSC